MNQACAHGECTWCIQRTPATSILPAVLHWSREITFELHFLFQHYRVEYKIQQVEVLPTFNYPPNKVTNPRPQGRGTLLTQFVPGVHFRRCFGDCEWKPSRAPTSGDCDDEPPRNPPPPLRRVSQSVGGVTQFVMVVGGCYWGKENPAQRLLGNGCTSSVLLKFPLLRWVDLRRSNCQVVVVLSAQTSNILNRLFLLIILKSTWF